MLGDRRFPLRSLTAFVSELPELDVNPRGASCVPASFGPDNADRAGAAQARWAALRLFHSRTVKDNKNAYSNVVLLIRRGGA
jgi:hypothetical protein